MTPAERDVRDARDRLGVGTIFPRQWVEQLVAAGERRDHAAIDRVTDQMALAGLIRPRKACGRFESIAAQSREASAS